MHSKWNWMIIINLSFLVGISNRYLGMHMESVCKNVLQDFITYVCICS